MRRRKNPKKVAKNKEKTKPSIKILKKDQQITQNLYNDRFPEFSHRKWIHHLFLRNLRINLVYKIPRKKYRKVSKWAEEKKKGKKPKKMRRNLSGQNIFFRPIWNLIAPLERAGKHYLSWQWILFEKTLRMAKFAIVL